MIVRADPLTWGDYLEKLIVKHNPACGVDSVRREIESGNIAAWGIVADDVPIGCFVTRIDRRYDGGKDLVMLFLVSDEKPPVAITKVTYELLEKIAGERGISHIRTHPDNPALVRIAEHAGFCYIETVMQKAVRNVIK